MDWFRYIKDASTDVIVTSEQLPSTPTTSWYYGAGQSSANGDDSITGRFDQSCGLNVWNEGELSLLNYSVVAANQIEADAPSILLENDPYLFQSSGNDVLYQLRTLTGSESGPFCSLPDNSFPITSLTTDGTYQWAAKGGVYQFSSSSEPVQIISGTVDKVGFTGDRLIASYENKLYDITSQAYASSASALPEPMFTYGTDLTWQWIGFVIFGDHLYAAGTDGDGFTNVLKILLPTESSGASSAGGAAFNDETCTGFGSASYDGEDYLFIGTSVGFKLLRVRNSLNVGSLVQINSPVRAFAQEDMFVWFGWEANHPSGRPGLGRIDLRRFTAFLTPAYASDIYPGQDMPSGAVLNSIVRHQDVRSKRTIFALFNEADDIENFSRVSLVAEEPEYFPIDEGWLDTGAYSWGLDTLHKINEIDISTKALPQYTKVSLEMTNDSGTDQTYDAIGAGRIFHRYYSQESVAYNTEFRIRIFPYDDTQYGNPTGLPVVTEFAVKALRASLPDIEKNTNYSYPNVRRKLSRFIPSDLIGTGTWLSVNLNSMNLDTYADQNLQDTYDESSYLLVYQSDEYGLDLLPTKSLIHDGVLYFQAAATHLPGVPTYGEYYLYYHTPNIRYVEGYQNGPEIFDDPFDYRIVDPEDAPYVVDIDDVDDLTYEVTLDSDSSYNFSFVNSQSDWTQGQTKLPGAKLYLTFTGPSISIYGSKGPDFGKVKITLTGLSNQATPNTEVEEKDIIVDCYSQTFEQNVLLFSRTSQDLSYRDYTLELVVIPEKNQLSTGNRFKVSSYRFNYNIYSQFESEEINKDLTLFSSGFFKLNKRSDSNA